MRPLIGLTTSLEDGEQRLDLRYVRAVERAGGIPVILPITDEPDVRLPLLDRIRGLLIPGGPAVELGMRGDRPDDLDPTPPERWHSDLAYLDAALERRYPVLGICYGMQLLNARLGGTIWADVQRQVPGTEVHSARRGGERHGVRFESGSRLRAIVGLEETQVNTRHVQAIRSPAPGLRVNAVSPDGVIEGIESDDGLQIGVQFHAEREPEQMRGLFEYFVNKSRPTL